jgi:hypothetical protein
VTACLWRQASDDRWHTGNIVVPSDRDDPDGADGLLELVLDGSPRWLAAVRRGVLRGIAGPSRRGSDLCTAAVTDELVTALNRHRTPAELAEDLDSIG